MKTMFLDSNVFLQCRDIKELSWEDLLNGDTELKLLVPRGVQKEIDNFKGQGNNRRSKRARLASSYFRDILKSPDDSISIKENVILSFPKSRELSKVLRADGLDSNRNDDSIIQDILAFRALYPDEAATLISDDTNLIATAKEYEVPFIFTPNDWQLSPEPDETTKTINLLKQENANLKKNFPEIDLKVTPEKLRLDIYRYPRLTDNQTNEIIESIVRNFEGNQSSFGNYQASTGNYFSLYTAPSEQAIHKYKTETLPAWKEKAKLALQSIHEDLYIKKNCFNITFSISNIGNVPAENLLVTLEGSESLFLLSNSEYDNLSENVSLPKMPDPPEPTMLGDYGSLLKGIQFRMDPPLKINHFNTPPARDRNSFYWQRNMGYLARKSQEASCEEFRHKMTPEVFSFWLVVANDSNPTGGSLTCTVSAKNLSDPKQLVLPIKIDYHQADTLEDFNGNYFLAWCLL